MRDILREDLNDPDIRQQIINMYTDNKDYILHVMNDRIKSLEFHSAKYKDRASKTELEKAKKALEAAPMPDPEASKAAAKSAPTVTAEATLPSWKRLYLAGWGRSIRRKEVTYKNFMKYQPYDQMKYLYRPTEVTGEPVYGRGNDPIIHCIQLANEQG